MFVRKEQSVSGNIDTVNSHLKTSIWLVLKSPGRCRGFRVIQLIKLVLEYYITP